jgi:hypothetical protein
MDYALDKKSVRLMTSYKSKNMGYDYFNKWTVLCVMELLYLGTCSVANKVQGTNDIYLFIM